MALVIGHSQTKWLHSYIDVSRFEVFSWPGYRVNQFQKQDVIFEVAPFFSVSCLFSYTYTTELPLYVSVFGIDTKAVTDVHVIINIIFCITTERPLYTNVFWA